MQIAAKKLRILILDEIINSLNLKTKEHLIQVLKKYSDAMIIVSQEEGFLKAIDVDHAYTIVDSRIT